MVRDFWGPVCGWPNVGAAHVRADMQDAVPGSGCLLAVPSSVTVSSTRAYPESQPGNVDRIDPPGPGLLFAATVTAAYLAACGLPVSPGLDTVIPLARAARDELPHGVFIAVLMAAATSGFSQ
ncbi:hypothetical protein QCN29_33775 [Streptomyces sp. HNM0663]|uniref:Uncharacterized protein n=1 Tax=Streptomyces chengmaiensis TaxID=3040919 RepID=A0ABT6HY86_9ACTN|nr:hypothetical protein [Streptomyces chengmaiensis]MDH2393645.1 hypothetical protein [Streptomyces chengmaiensis]